MQRRIVTAAAPRKKGAWFQRVNGGEFGLLQGHRLRDGRTESSEFQREHRRMHLLVWPKPRTFQDKKERVIFIEAHEEHHNTELINIKHGTAHESVQVTPAASKPGPPQPQHWPSKASGRTNSRLRLWPSKASGRTNNRRSQSRRGAALA